MVISNFFQSTLASIQTSFLLAYVVIIACLLALIPTSIYLVRRLVWRLVKTKHLVYLELIIPSTTTKTSYSTEQLFILLHSLAKQPSLASKIIGQKGGYSLEISSTKEEGIRYILVIAAVVAPIIQKTLLSYLPGLKIMKIDDYLPTPFNLENNQQESKFEILELKLKTSFVLPLKNKSVLDEHDPVSYLTGQMTKLQLGEMMVFQTIVTPLRPRLHAKEHNHILKTQKQIYYRQPLGEELFKTTWQKALTSFPLMIIQLALKVIESLLKFVISMVIAFWNTSGDRVPFLVEGLDKEGQKEIQNPYELELAAAIKNKIDQPLFETSLRFFILAHNSASYRQRAAGFLASFESLASAHQSLILKRRSLLSSFRSSFSSFGTRKNSFTGNPFLSCSELAEIYHFPYTDTTKTEDLVKSKSRPLPAPLSFKQVSVPLDNVFAKNNYGGTETPIGQTLEERRRHTYILGATGSGKTNLLSNMIYNDIVNGKGVAVVDPHGDLTEKILRVIPKERIKDVVWFAPDDDGFPIALNLLELPTNPKLTKSELQKQKSLITSSIISIIQKFYDAKFFGPRMEYVLRNTILTALETPEPTLQTILDLLTKTRYRKEVVVGLKNKVLSDYWIYEFNKLGVLQRNTVISPITNKIGGVLSSPINYNILSQTKSKIDFGEVIESGKILLCDLSKGKIGEDESSFFGSLTLAKIQLAILGRAHIPEKERKDFYLYVDEFQNFATDTFSDLVSEARKYHLSVIIAHQSISQIENRDIIKIILANVGTVICFKTANSEDEQFILPIFSPEVAKHEISNLPLYNFYMKLSVTEAKDTFLAQADCFNPEENEETAKAVIDHSRKVYATQIKLSIHKEDQSNKTKAVAKNLTKPPKSSQKDEPKNNYILP